YAGWFPYSRGAALQADTDCSGISFRRAPMAARFAAQHGMSGPRFSRPAERSVSKCPAVALNFTKGLLSVLAGDEQQHTPRGGQRMEDRTTMGTIRSATAWRTEQSRSTTGGSP